MAGSVIQYSYNNIFHTACFSAIVTLPLHHWKLEYKSPPSEPQMARVTCLWPIKCVEVVQWNFELKVRRSLLGSALASWNIFSMDAPPSPRWNAQCNAVRSQRHMHRHSNRQVQLSSSCVLSHARHQTCGWRSLQMIQVPNHSSLSQPGPIHYEAETSHLNFCHTESASLIK